MSSYSQMSLTYVYYIDLCLLTYVILTTFAVLHAQILVKLLSTWLLLACGSSTRLQCSRFSHTAPRIFLGNMQSHKHVFKKTKKIILTASQAQGLMRWQRQLDWQKQRKEGFSQLIAVRRNPEWRRDLHRPFERLAACNANGQPPEDNLACRRRIADHRSAKKKQQSLQTFKMRGEAEIQLLHDNNSL